MSEDKVRTSILISRDVYERAKRKGKPFSHIVEEALHEHLNEGPRPTHQIKALQDEVATLAGQLHLVRAENSALRRELAALRNMNRALTTTLDGYVKTVAEAKKATARLTAREREINRKEVVLARKEKELAEREAEIEKKEKELTALAEHLHEKEERLLRWEQMLQAKLLSKRGPEWVKEILEKANLQAIGMRDLREKYDWDIFFTEEQLQGAVEAWPIIDEDEKTVIRDAGQGLIYRHLKDRPLAGFFTRNIKQAKS